jgi:hypothetical protein
MRKKRKKNYILVLFFLFFILFFYYLFFKFNIFNFSKVEIGGESAECVSNQQIIDSSKILGQNFFLVQTKSAVENIKSKFICIKNLTFNKSFPNKIKVDVISREPQVLILQLESNKSTTSSVLESIATPSAEQLSEGYLMDDEGVIFAKNLQNLNLPTIFVVNSKLAVGEKMSENILRVFQSLKLFGINAKSAILNDDSFSINSNPRVIFNIEEGLDVQLASLQLILEKAKIDSEVLEFIDLRFDKPIVRIAPKKK